MIRIFKEVKHTTDECDQQESNSMRQDHVTWTWSDEAGGN